MRLGYQAQLRRTYSAICGFNEAEAHAPRIPTRSPRYRNWTASASMRPRRMRLGYTETLFSRPNSFPGFNEAEAHAPRILIMAIRLVIMVICFNEAEAHAPRIPEQGFGGQDN